MADGARPPSNRSHFALLAALLWLLSPAGWLLAAGNDSPPSPEPILSISPAIADEVAGYAASADDLYHYIQEWNDKRIDLGKIAASGGEWKPRFHAFIQDKVAHLQPAFHAFLERYPQDARRWDVKLLRLWYLDTEEHIPAQEYLDTYREVVAAPEASHRAKRRARYMLLQDLLSHAGATLDDFVKSDQEMTAYEKDFPEDDSGAELVTTRLASLGVVAPERIVPMLQNLIASPNEATARASRDQLALRTQPLDLRFTALDGTRVDLTELRGKVVLLDFWATWCAPCMAKVPEVLALQRKYGSEDFQLLGISLDEDQDAARKVIAGKGMSWPQNCDGKGWKSEIAQRFDVHEIPNVWLIDKKGMAHPLDMEKDDLDARIAESLAEP